ncbi:ATP phosphoribosyltransferase [Patescibacteria group bacterium]|nr:ATP phosphoribosyltransferase [Patescibacteria group bacterium]
MGAELKEIRIGLPKGSLNTPGRANTYEILTNAGYDVRGYEPGKESAKVDIANDPEIRAFITRPQRSPVDLSKGFLDTAIIGDDWVEEDRVNGSRSVRKIGDLEYGQTRLIIAVSEPSDFQSLSDVFEALRDKKKRKPIYFSTEYVNLTARAILQNEAYREIFGLVSPFVQYRGMTRGRNRLVQILGSDGATEQSIEMGYAVISDNSQTGRSLRENRLRAIDEIMESSVGLYAGPSCKGWKEVKAQEIFDQLYGAVVGKKYFDVKFNVPLPRLDELREYLVEEGLCADEPTIIQMKKFAAVNILIRRNRFPSTLQELRRLGASTVVRSEVKQYIE